MRQLAFLLFLSSASFLFADAPRVLKPGTLPSDARLGNLKTLNGHFPFIVSADPGHWDVRSEQLRRRVLVATGLWPMPEKTPLEPVIHGKVKRDGFTVEKVYFQSLPGHYVTGLLFRPDTPSEAPRPAVLSPHGHGGRMQKHSDAELARQLSVGAEHFERSGQMPKIARCAQLARMGCVTFIFDMLGYADSKQISHSVAHRHQNARPEEADSTSDRWVLYSAQADLRLQSVMGLQTWNCIRSLDFLASLPDVDPDQLAVTGGSGGGTQSILLGAIDERVKVSFPNGMVSTSMQGGCYCENCNYLRIDTGNVELAALFAPRPQAMTAADDWTRDMMSDGYPELKWLYAMIGDESDVYCRPMLHFKHNYNYVTRATMYQWMNRHLELGLDDPIIERDFEPLTDVEATVWNDDHPLPGKVGVEHERDLCRWLEDQASDKLDQIRPRDEESLSEFRRVMGGAWEVIFDRLPPTAGDLRYDQIGQLGPKDLSIERGLVANDQSKSSLPVFVVGDRDSAQRVVVWSDGRGKSAAFDGGQPSELLRNLANDKTVVIVADLLGQGEFNAHDRAITVQRLVDDKRSYSAFTFGYNRTLTAERCGDMLTLIGYAREIVKDNVSVLGTSGSAGWVAPAVAIAGAQVERAVVTTDGFRFGTVSSYRDANFVPGAVKYGDLPALLALRAPHKTMVLGETESPSLVTDAFEATGYPFNVDFKKGPVNEEVVRWLVRD